MKLNNSQKIRPIKVDVWAVLHLPLPGDEMHDLIRHQMPYLSFEPLAGMLGMDEKMLSRCLEISLPTLFQRAKTGHFSFRESRCLYMLVTVIQASCDLFEGNVQASRSFLFSPSRHLHSTSPLEVLRRVDDASTIIDFIGRLEHGVLL